MLEPAQTGTSSHASRAVARTLTRRESLVIRHSAQPKSIASFCRVFPDFKRKGGQSLFPFAVPRAGRTLPLARGDLSTARLSAASLEMSPRLVAGGFRREGSAAQQRWWQCHRGIHAH
jgi:hypothetical protein